MMIALPEMKLLTSNFTLEAIKPKHAGLLFEQLQSSALYKFIPINAPKSISDLEAKYTSWSVGHSENEDEIWENYAIYNPSDDQYLGTLQATIETNGKTYIAYNVFPCFWRQGIATEAVSVLITHLFERYNSSVITAHLDTKNISSYKLLESLGFIRKTTINDADYFKGRTSHEYVYELSKTNWG